MRTKLGREQRFDAVMTIHEKNDQTKYRKIQLNVAGIKEFIFDSYGNPITARKDKPQPRDIEIIKPEFKIGTIYTPSVMSPYYASVYQTSTSKMFPPPLPDSKMMTSVSLALPQQPSNKKSKRAKVSLLDEHMTASQRAQSEGLLPSLEIVPQGSVQLSLGRVLYGKVSRSSLETTQQKQPNNASLTRNLPKMNESATFKLSSMVHDSSLGSIKPTFTFGEDTNTLHGSIQTIVRPSIKKEANQKKITITVDIEKVLVKKLYLKKTLTHKVHV